MRLAYVCYDNTCDYNKNKIWFKEFYNQLRMTSNVLAWILVFSPSQLKQIYSCILNVFVKQNTFYLQIICQDY